jgi:hypothetical protein
MKVLGRDGNIVSHSCVRSYFSSTSRNLPLEQSNADWEQAKVDNDIIKIFVLLYDSHNFYGKTASLVEQTAIRLKHDTFI